MQWENLIIFLVNLIFGDNLNFKNGKIRFLLNPFDEKFSGFFDIKTPNIFIETNFISIKIKLKK